MVARLKRDWIGIAALVLAVASLGLHFRGVSPKIAYAETSILLTGFSEAAKARQTYENSQKEWDANLKRLNDTLTAAMGRMKAGYDKARPAERDSMRAALQKSNEDLQRYTSAVKKMAETKERELMDPVIKKMNGYLSRWGREHGYSMILGTMTGGNILQANESMNLTQAILRDMNAAFADPVPAAAPNSTTNKSAVKGSGT